MLTTTGCLRLCNSGLLTSWCSLFSVSRATDLRYCAVPGYCVFVRLNSIFWDRSPCSTAFFIKIFRQAILMLMTGLLMKRPIAQVVMNNLTWTFMSVINVEKIKKPSKVSKKRRKLCPNFPVWKGIFRNYYRNYLQIQPECVCIYFHKYPLNASKSSFSPVSIFKISKLCLIWQISFLKKIKE